MKNYTHLTNYSINKFNKASFVSEGDGGEGSKWSFPTFREKLRELKIDDKLIFKRIEDIVIKTIISAEPLLNNGCEMFVPHRNNCFELLGFDILIDDKLQAKLLEVNLSPSLTCDSQLDQDIKSSLIADLFTMAGVSNNDFKRQSHANSAFNTLGSKKSS